MLERVQKIDRRNASNVAVARWIFSAITLTAVTRLVTWLLSLFLIGPVFGAATLPLILLLGSTSPIPVEVTMALAAVVMAVAIGTGMRSDPERWRSRARWFGVALMIDVTGYLASIAVALILLGGLSNLIDLVPALIPVFLLNFVLLWMGATIARRARRAAERPPT